MELRVKKSNMKAIFGLGNPEKKYEKTRHNAGFIVIDKIAEELSLTWGREDKLKALIAKKDDLLLVKPQTFMNNSGGCIRAVKDFYKLESSKILVVHDDVDLPFGKIKLQIGASSAGHNGVSDIIEKLGTQEFWRLRIGVGRPENAEFDVTDWVLGDLTPEELDFVRSIKVDDWMRQ